MKINVVGWYEVFNLGDQAFKSSFRKYLGECTFSNFAWPGFDHYIFGAGGSPTERVLNSIKSGVIDTKTPIRCMGTDIPLNGQEWDKFRNFNWKFIGCRSVKYTKIANEQNLLVHHTPDIVFGCDAPVYPESKEDTITVIPMMHVSGHQHINSHVEEQLLFALSKLKDKYQIKFLPFCFAPTDSDYLYSLKLCRMLNLPDENVLIKTDLDDVMNFLAQQKLVITERFHGAILSTMAGTPFVNIAYSGKHTEFTKDNNLEFAYLTPLYSSDHLLDKAKALIADAEWSERLKMVTATNKKLVAASFEVLKETIP